MTDMPLALVADIGGTNTRVAMADGPDVLMETVTRYPNRDYPGLAQVLSTYVTDRGITECSGACVALAGPVANGHGTLTNLNWSLSEAELARAAKTGHARIFNDLQAQGYGLPNLAADRLHQITPGQPCGPEAARLVINVGTGFNIAAVFPRGGRHLVPAAEAGHADLPVRSELEFELAEYLRDVVGFSSIEDILSGRGLVQLYRFFAQRAGVEADLSGAEIVEGFEAGTNPIAQETIAQFTRSLAIVASNLTISLLPFAGVYISGGLGRVLGRHLAGQGFVEQFCARGRFSQFMEQFPVHAIEDDYAALTGCAGYLAESPKS